MSFLVARNRKYKFVHLFDSSITHIYQQISSSTVKHLFSEHILIMTFSVPWCSFRFSNMAEKRVLPLSWYSRESRKVKRLTKRIRMEYDQMSFIFNIFPFAVNILVLSMLLYIDPFGQKIITRRFDIILWTFQRMKFSANPCACIR